MVSGRRKLTTVHDVSGAWTGIGAGLYALWQQRKASSSILEVIAVVTYLTTMLVLQIASSSIMHWQGFDTMLTGVLPADLAMPGSAVNISQLGWQEIFPIARTIGQDTSISTYGLWNSTLYDVPQALNNDTFSTASINATTVNVQCGLVPNLTLSDRNSEGEYQITFLNGVNNGSFLESPICGPLCTIFLVRFVNIIPGKDVVYSIRPSSQVNLISFTSACGISRVRSASIALRLCST